MDNSIAYTKEGKQILEIYENMTPWDRNELMNYIAFHKMSGDEYYDSFIKDTEYDRTVNEDEADIVSEVINQDLEEDVLGAIDDSKIVEYVCNHEIIDEVLKEELDEEVIAKALNELDGMKLHSVLCKLSLISKKVEIGQLELKKV